ncbi:Protein SCAR1 [Linum grandiflorum]
MPLVRFQVRNEFSLGQPELYKDANVDDPKAVLDGVAVAGLVGILRQLGDLAEFAAEVFHGLQEQLTTTATRSQKLKLRVQNIEAALPPIEKAILAQNSHIHFAYTSASEWHPRIQSEQNHFIYNDLPRFIMDSYEECRDPPRFHILDKFDTGGPGSCLKRYSDPTFFRRASGGFKDHDAEKVQRDKKARKVKKRRSLRRKGSSLQNGSISSHSERSQFFQPTVNGRSSSSHTPSTIDLTLKSETGDRSNSIDSRNGSNHIECVFRPSSSAQPEEQKSNGFSSRSLQGDDSRDSGFSEEQSRVVDDSFLHCSSPKQISHRSPGVIWVEKEEREEPGVADDSFLHCSSPKQINHRSPGVIWVQKEEREEPGVADNSFLHGPSPDLIPISSSSRTWEEKSEGKQPEAHKGSLPRSSAEPLPPGFSCVTWDEKEEISEAESQHYDGDEAPDVLTVDSVVDTRESGTNTEIHHPTDLRFVDEDVPRPSSTAATLLDDVESEADNFMDALNSIDTESESELDYQTKHEVKEVECAINGRTAGGHNEGSAVTSGLTNHEMKLVECAIDEGRTKDRHDEVSATTSGHHPQHDMASDVLIPVPSVSPDKEQTHSSESSSSSSSSSTASDSESDILASTTVNSPGASKVESPVFDRSSGILVKEVKEPLADIALKDSGKPQESSVTEFKEVEEPLADIVLTDPIKPQESPITELSHVEPIKLWTNGGLLGLQPSKPPDFNVSNAGSQGSETNTAEMVNTPMPNNNADSSERPSGSRSSESCHNDNVAKAKDAIDPNYRSRFHPYDRGLNANSPTTPGNGLPLGSFIKFTTSGGGASHENDGYPSQNMFGLGQRLLANGFGRKISLAPSCESELASSSPQPLVKFQANQPDDLDIRFGHKSSDSDYLTSSPPLEHMKLSFQPTGGAEASKLQLKFPDGSYCNESSTDMFPSFQLVPEAGTGRNDAISDSDDDTFCRSSPYLSDDCLSHHSDTDSDQWEAGQSPESVHNSDHDTSCAIESVKTNGLHIDDTERPDGSTASSCLSASVLDLPSFDSVKPPLEEVRNNEDRLQQPKASSSPFPPPLPPAQWCLSKESKPDTLESKPPAAPQIAFVPKFVLPPTTQQPKPAPATEKQAHPVIVPFTPKSKVS